MCGWMQADALPMLEVTDLQDAAFSASNRLVGGVSDDYTDPDEDMLLADASFVISEGATGDQAGTDGWSAQQGGLAAGSPPAAPSSLGSAVAQAPPLLIALRGSAHVRVAVYEPYTELGAAAQQLVMASSPGVSGSSSSAGSSSSGSSSSGSSSSRTVPVAVEVQGTVDTQAVTPSGRPLTVGACSCKPRWALFLPALGLTRVLAFPSHSSYVRRLFTSHRARRPLSHTRTQSLVRTVDVRGSGRRGEHRPCGAHRNGVRRVCSRTRAQARTARRCWFHPIPSWLHAARAPMRSILKRAMHGSAIRLIRCSLVSYRCSDSMQCSVLGACDARLLATADLVAAARAAAIATTNSSSNSSSNSSWSFSAGASALVAGSLLTSAAEYITAAATAPDAAAALPPSVVVSELELAEQEADLAAAGGASQQPQNARRLLADTTPPAITLLGEGQLYDTGTGTGSVYGMIHTVFVGETFLDPGAVALDLVDTYPDEPKQESLLDPSLIAVTITAPSGALVSAVRTDVPTGNAAAGGSLPYVLAYDVADAAGNRARTVYRRVYVFCRTPEVACFGSGGAARSCSVAGVCGAGAAADLLLAPAALAVSVPAAATVAAVAAGAQAASSSTAAAPTLTLLGSSSVRVRAGVPYDRCQGLDTESCDPGANATVAAAGDLAGRVVACADRAAAAGVAAPRPFVLVGLRYCGLDTRRPGRHIISFHLPLLSDGGAAASAAAAGDELVVRRVVVVEELCEEGEQPCGDGRCSAGGVCADMLAGLSAAATAGAAAAALLQTSGTISTTTGAASSAGLLAALKSQLAYAATATSGGSSSSDAATAAAAYVSPLGAANQPPQLRLRSYPPAVLEGQAVAVRQGTAYRRCAAGQVPTPQLPCEPNATAWDAEDGNITQLVSRCCCA